MKAIKYLAIAGLMIGFSTGAVAQEDVKTQIANITKVIKDSKGNAEAVKEPVKAFYKLNKKSAQALTGLGRAFLDVNDTANAKKYADEALKRDNHYGDAYILQGDIEAVKDDGGQAAMWYQNAKTMDPKNPRGYIKYASVYRGRSPEEAFKSLEELRAIMPDYPVDAEGAHFFYGARKYDQAVTLFGRVPMNKLNKEQLHEYALAAYFDGNNDKSLEVAKAGNAQYPRDAVFNRLTFYNSLAKKDYPTAVQFAKALFTASDSAKLIARDYMMAGHAYMGDKNYTEAVNMFKQSLSMEDNNDVRKLISDAYSEAGDVDNALAAYNAYISKKSDATANDYMSLAEIYTNAADKATDAQKVGYFKQADKVYGDIATKFPDYEAYATYMRANVNANIDPELKQGLAKPYYEKLISIVNGHSTAGSNDKAYLKQAYYYMGVYYYVNGNKEEGDVYWKKLLEIDPDNANAKSALGIK